MITYPFRKLDAFTAGTAPGNPAGCVLLESADDITAEQMQRIAFELDSFVSEVGYIWPTPAEGWDYELRYFSREREVHFCGHATVAIMYDLLRRMEKTDRPARIKIKTPAGLLDVEDRVQSDHLVFIDAPRPQYLDIKPSDGDIIRALNLPAGALSEAIPVAAVNAGLNTLLVPVKTLSDCIDCRPGYEQLRLFSEACGIEVINLFTLETALPDTDVRTRVFCPLFGYLEDPATGSGNAALGYYLDARHLWSKDLLKIEQGISGQYPNIVTLMKTDAGLKIGGQSACRIEGTYILTGDTP